MNNFERETVLRKVRDDFLKLHAAQISRDEQLSKTQNSSFKSAYELLREKKIARCWDAVEKFYLEEYSQPRSHNVYPDATQGAGVWAVFLMFGMLLYEKNATSLKLESIIFILHAKLVEQTGKQVPKDRLLEIYLATNDLSGNFSAQLNYLFDSFNTYFVLKKI